MNYAGHKLRFSAIMAWRETRAAAGKFAFLVFAIALGVAALTAVTGFNESVHHTLSREARSLMAADVSVRLPRKPGADALKYVDRLEAEGIMATRVTETVSMASTGRTDRSLVLVSVKGADFDRYPFYGQLQFDPAGTRLDETSVVVSDDLLLRLSLRVNDTLRVGEREFRIAGRVTSEPDRMTTGFTLGPRVLFTREGLQSTGIVTDISRVTERILFKLPENRNLSTLRAEILAAFGPRARVTDYTETNPTLTRVLQRSTRFLSMVSLIALIVSGLGVGATMQSHLRQKMPHIAFMKCVGGRSEHILHIYLTQAFLLGLAGSAVGILLGAFAQTAFASLVAGYFDVAIIKIWPVAAMMKGALAGLVTTTLFALPSLLAIRRIRPALLLRRDYGDAPSSRRDWASLAAAGVAILGLWGIAVWVSASAGYASLFAGSLVVGILILGLAGTILLRMLRRASTLSQVRRSRALRHGIANLYRPGAHAVAILTSLAIGVMFTMSVYFVQHSLLDEIRLSAPPDAPNVFLINITERERDGIAKILEDDPSVVGPHTLSPSVTAQLTLVDGSPPERYENTQFVLTWSEQMPPATEILQGDWWTGGRPEEPLVSVTENAAENLGLRIGSLIEWKTSTGRLGARVGSVRRTDAARAGGNNQFILSPGALDGFSTAYIGSVRVRSGGIGALQARVFDQYPTVTVVNAADILEIVQDVLDKASQAVQFVAAFAICGGLIVLASSVAGTRYRRTREAAIFKTVGATKGTLVRIFSVEFAVIGIVAGFLGSVLATLLSSILVGELLDAPYHFRWLPTFVATGATALLTVSAGWLASYRILGKKPLEILRNIE
jgi:putative ABC transport system permease protein